MFGSPEINQKYDKNFRLTGFSKKALKLVEFVWAMKMKRTMSL